MKKICLLFMVMAACLVLGACADTNSSSLKTNNTDTKNTEVSQEYNKFVFASGTEPVSLDPHVPTDLATGRVLVNIYEGLVTTQKDSKIVGVLAKDWSVSEDGLKWTFYLRDGVKFHDGTDFNAEAVKITIERLLDPENAYPRASVLNMIDNIEIKSEYEVVIKTKTPTGDLLPHLTTFSCGIISPAALDKYGDELGQNPVGTGPLKLKSWELGTKVILEKNTEYWGPQPTTDELEIVVVPESSTRAMLIQSEDCDISWGISPIQVPLLEKSDNVTVDVETGFRTIFIGMNLKQEIFKNDKVREAVCYAINNDPIIKNVLSGFATHPVGIESTVLPYSAKESDIKPYEYNPEKAKALLAEAGYPDGLKTTFHTSEGRYIMDKQVAEVVQAQLAEVGIEAEFVVMDWAAYLSALSLGEDINLFLIGKGSSTGDPRNDLNLQFYTGNSNNYSFCSYPEFDECIDKAMSETNMEVRGELLIEAQKIIHENKIAYPLYYESQIVARKSNVEGMIIFPNETVSLGYLTRK